MFIFYTRHYQVVHLVLRSLYNALFIIRCGTKGTFYAHSIHIRLVIVNCIQFIFDTNQRKLINACGSTEVFNLLIM